MTDYAAAASGEDVRSGEAENALCLSGGGYRAAIFHLGALLRLHELGHLRSIGLISSVSGGSIASAWLAACYLRQRHDHKETFPQWCDRIDFKAQVVDAFQPLAGTDLRTWPVLATLPWNWLWPSSRVALLRRGYEGFYGHLQLRDLPANPRFVFCATDLNFGVNWEFSRQRTGDFQAGYLRRHGKITLAFAVAASSCFPPLFGPVRFPARAEDFIKGAYHGENGDLLRDRIELSDGGVYDNMAMEPAIKRCALILVSDAGAPFDFVAGQHYFRRLLRYAGVIGNQALALRRRLFYRGREAGDFRGAYWNISQRNDAGAAGYSLGLCENLLAGTRTDLDKFTAVEFGVLVNHGYFSCEDGLHAQPGLVPAGAPGARWPFPQYSSEDEVRRALSSSHRRLWHLRWFDR